MRQVRMRSHFVIFCCFIAPATSGQAPWNVQSLRPLTQYLNLSTALSSNGEVYIAGGPSGFNWPPPTTSIGDTSSEETLVSKLDASGNPLYVTAIGGAVQTHLTLDAAGNLYVYGPAEPKFFATTPRASNSSAYPTVGNYVCKLRAADGSILFCSLFAQGGIPAGGLTADPMGNVYFGTTGSPPSVGPTQGALALGTRSVQVTKLNPVGAIVYIAEFSGPQGSGRPASVAIDAQGNVWVAGRADADFPTTPNALLPSTPQSGAGFLAELNPSGTALLYSTFTDGAGQNAQIALDGGGNVYEMDLTTSGAILRKYSPGGAAILYKQDFANTGLLRFALDAAGNVTALGVTSAVNFPTYHPIDACAPINPNSAPSVFNSWILIRADASGELIQSTFLKTPVYLTDILQVASNGYFLATVFPNLEHPGPGQLEIGQLGPAASLPINLSCAGNAASLTFPYLTLPALAPGEIVSLFGNGLGPAAPASAQFVNNRLPFNLAGSQVTVNGIPAPLLYASDAQINAIVPWEIQGASTANVCVVYQNNSTNCMTMNVAGAAPGIFQLPSGFAAAVNQDGTINSQQSPAAMGSIVSLYVNGLGPLSPQPADGSIVDFPLPALANVVRALFRPYGNKGVADGQVLYAGPAPLEVAGLYQINVMIPAMPVSRTPIPPASIDIGVARPGGSFVYTTQSLAISIQGINAGNGALP